MMQGMLSTQPCRLRVSVRMQDALGAHTFRELCAKYFGAPGRCEAIESYHHEDLRQLVNHLLLLEGLQGSSCARLHFYAQCITHVNVML